MIKVGIIGSGEFAKFAMSEFVKNENINAVAVFDINNENAKSFSHTFKCKIYTNCDELYSDPSTDLIYISSPPSFHYAQSKESLLNGKHVICEKPVALKVTEAEELASLANEKGLLYVVNLMQPYNPVSQIVKSIIDNELLGSFLHGYFENYASDEFLGENHWFWDKDISGGIFIEHGVHFFDLYQYWLGNYKLIHASQLIRTINNRNYYDCVQAVIKVNERIVNIYHGFDQPKMLDRQEFKFLFEYGDITLNDWVPSQISINGLFIKENLQKVRDIVQTDKVDFIKVFKNTDHQLRSRFKDYKPDFFASIQKKLENKETVYRLALRNFINDQISWLQNKQHKRLVTIKNAIDSLKIAVEAQEIADKTL